MRYITLILILVASTEVFTRPAINGDQDSGTSNGNAGDAEKAPVEDNVDSPPPNDETSDEPNAAVGSVQGEDDSVENRAEGSNEINQDSPTEAQDREDEQGESNEDDEQEKGQVEEPEPQDTNDGLATDDAQLKAVNAMETTATQPSLEDSQATTETMSDHTNSSESTSSSSSTEEREKQTGETKEDDDQEKRQLEDAEQQDTDDDMATDAAQLKAANAMETTETGPSLEDRQSTTETIPYQLNSTESTSSSSSTEESGKPTNATKALGDEVTVSNTFDKEQHKTKNDNATLLEGVIGSNHTQKIKEALGVLKPTDSTSTNLSEETTTLNQVEKVNAQEEENNVTTVESGDDEYTNAPNTTTASAKLLLRDSGEQTATHAVGIESDQAEVNGSSTKTMRVTSTIQHEIVNGSSFGQTAPASSSKVSHTSEPPRRGTSTSSVVTVSKDREVDAVQATMPMTEVDEQTIDSSLANNIETTDAEIPVMNAFSFDLPMFNESLHGDLLLNDTEWAKDLAAAAHPDDENLIHDPCTFISENIHSFVGLNVSKEQVQNTLPTFRFLLESSTEDLATIKDMLMACVQATTNNQDSVDPGCLQIRSLIGKTCQQFDQCRGKEESVMHRVMKRIREVIDTDQLADALLMIRACAGQSYD